MDKDEAIGYVVDVLKHKLRMNPAIIISDNYDALLTGDIFNLTDIELTYIALELNKSGVISMDEKMFSDYRFITINKIADCILSQCAAVQ